MFADELLEQALTASKLNKVDRALAMELFYGCLRQRLALEFLRGQLMRKPPCAGIAVLIDIGLYQLFFLERIPAHAAVHEMVELAKKRASPARSGASADEAGFVNAVLRRASRERATLLASLRAKRQTEPWIYYSHPRWLWERWTARWGREQTEALCEWNNTPPPVYLRVNSLKIAGRPSDVAAEPTRFHPLAWKIANAAEVFRTKSWANGEFYVQDPSTLLAVDVLDPQPDESVLDACAAPGGKTTYIAQKMQDRGRIVASDSSSFRLKLVAENCKRLGATIVACKRARVDDFLHNAEFDRVLVDAPCSNTGVLRRRADLRWRIEEKEITRLAALQEKLLATAARLTRPGGILVYSTCSLEREENERVVERFSGQHPEFTLETTRSTFPPRDGVDGAFVARFRRR